MYGCACVQEHWRGLFCRKIYKCRVLVDCASRRCPDQAFWGGYVCAASEKASHHHVFYDVFMSRGVVFMSGIYFALIRAKNYAAALITHSFCCIPERTDSFWPIKVSCVSILKHGHGFYYRVPMFSAFLRRKRTSARTKMSSQLWYRLDMWCTRIPNQ